MHQLLLRKLKAKKVLKKIIDKINIVHDLSLNVEAMRSKEVKNANVKNAKMNRILRATVICIFSIMLY